ncbi:MAG TPA: glycoside hydrolase family 31 protein [Chloroflexaceae bacterium]|nr:glycoside hydrolase family 31 protein [Chloroflexaceae bacterium]
MTLALESPKGRLTIGDDGRLTIERGGRVVLRSAASPAFAAVFGIELGALAPAEARREGEALLVRYPTLDPGVSLTLEARVAGGGFRLRWSGQPPLPALGVRWELAAGRPWYGQGERVVQPWPLDRLPNEADPLEPIDFARDGTLNIAAPLWLNAAGAALHIAEGEGELAASLDRGGDGLLRLLVRAAPPPPGLGFDEPYAAVGPLLELDVALGDDLPGAYAAAQAIVGRPTVAPPADLFARPIWTTWAHYKMGVTQADVESFAQTIAERGYPRSVLEIDDRWQRAYGAASFDAAKFPDPRAMVERLHALGFKVTLWTPTFFNPAGEDFAEAARRGYLIRHPADGAPYLVRWWQGYGANLDITNPEARAWWLERLRALQRETGVDGFKFDAGEANFVPPDARTYAGGPRRRYADTYAAWVAEHFEYTEVRCGWRSQSRGILFREWDKWSRWGLDNGLHSVLTQALALSIVGYPFVLPDMIGGNAYNQELPDGELMARWTQLTALMPSMQFGIPPWRYDDETDAICRRYALLHEGLAPYLADVVAETLRHGAPMVRPLAWAAPGDAVALTSDDQFLLGERFMAAPVVRAGQRSRDVYLPAGRWRDNWSGEEHEGPRLLAAVPAPLEIMPLYERLE